MRGIESCFTLEVKDLFALPSGHSSSVFIGIRHDGRIAVEDSFHALSGVDSYPDHRACKGSHYTLRRADAFQDEELMARYRNALAWTIVDPVPTAVSTLFAQRYGIEDLILERCTQSRGEGIIPTSIEIVHVNERRIIELSSKVLRQSALSCSSWTIDCDDSYGTDDWCCSSRLTCDKRHCFIKGESMDGVHGDTNVSFLEAR